MICANKRCNDPIVDCPLTNSCAGYIPFKTNADRIRAMSDGVLAQSIQAVSLGYAPWCDHHCKNFGDDGCPDCIRGWLRQSVKEE